MMAGGHTTSLRVRGTSVANQFTIPFAPRPTSATATLRSTCSIAAAADTFTTSMAASESCSDVGRDEAVGGTTDSANTKQLKAATSQRKRKRCIAIPCLEGLICPASQASSSPVSMDVGLSFLVVGGNSAAFATAACGLADRLQQQHRANTGFKTTTT